MTLLAPFLAYPLHVQSWNRPAGSVDYRVTNPYGGVDLVNPGQTHRGVDVGNTRSGDPIRAPATCRARGRRHTDGALGVELDLGGTWTLELWHLDRVDLPSEWAPVPVTMRVGITGASGKVAGAHTHIELKRARHSRRYGGVVSVRGRSAIASVLCGRGMDGGRGTIGRRWGWTVRARPGRHPWRARGIPASVQFTKGEQRMTRNVLTRGYAISRSEPVRSVGRWVASIVAGSVALTASVLTLLAAFGVSLEPAQMAAITGFVGTLAGIIGPLVGAEVARDRVTPSDG